MFNSFAERSHIMPLLAPVDAVATAKTTNFHKLAEVHRLQIFVFFGVITSTSADQVPIVTVEAASTNASGSEVQVAFDYRAFGVADTADSLGAKTAATATAGLQPATTDDNKLYVIEIDPAAILAVKATAKWFRLVITPDAGSSVCLVSAWAVADSRYGTNSQNSAT